MIRVKKFGNWEKLSYPIMVCEQLLTEELNKRVNELADNYLKTVAENIKSGKYTGQMPALAESTIRQKSSDLPWIDSGTFVDKLSKAESSQGRNTTVVAGALDDVTHHIDSSGERISMYQVAIWNEFGTIHQPGRPVFGLTFKDMENKMKGVAKDLNSEIVKAWSVL